MAQRGTMSTTEAIVDTCYISAGANRYPGVADWAEDGPVAFGADSNIGLWNPTDAASKGISRLYCGHTAHVRATRFLPKGQDERTLYLVSGGDDKTLRVWKVSPGDGSATCLRTMEAHDEPVNCIAALPTVFTGGNGTSRIFVSGSADAVLKVWAMEADNVRHLQTIKTTKTYIPLAASLGSLDGDSNGIVLAVAGTMSFVQVYTAYACADDTDTVLVFTLQATLPGHENWIRSLDFIHEKKSAGSDLLLASASQDKYIRLWRIHRRIPLSGLDPPALEMHTATLAPGNKRHALQAGPHSYIATFEALLVGHEDWVYSVRWARSSSGRLQLLSASADNSLGIWEADAGTAMWLTAARLGEMSREKGATTATGSTGGFWTGLWAPDASSVVTLGRTGSWRRWDWDAASERWHQGLAITGHTRAVTGISWARDGSYLLSTGTDQTTRLHAQWRANQDTWHEMARPQIHGYNLNCIDTLTRTSFVSGADEKLMRVFTMPRAVRHLLTKLTGHAFCDGDEADLPDAANMPVLGLSNKAIDSILDGPDTSPPGSSPDRYSLDGATTVRKSTLPMMHPPFEETLSRHTLFPEVEKLYGHGYELSCLAATQDGRLIASACRASSLNHAVLRLFETAPSWAEVRPPLAAHNLTAARVRFACDDTHLLSVGRDRQWAVFRRLDGPRFELLQANPKGHARMILDATWAPVPNGRVFATAGRDRYVKVWTRCVGRDYAPTVKMMYEHAVTALDFHPTMGENGHLILAVGMETGKLLVWKMKTDGDEVTHLSTWIVRPELCLSKPILQLAWRPLISEGGETSKELSVAGEDGSLRIYAVTGLWLS